MSGTIFDLTGSYRATFVNCVLWNLLNLSIMLWLLSRAKGRRVAHLRRMLASYSSYYNESRTHLALEKDAPLRRAIQRCGAIITTPILSGLHHRYVRI